MRITEILSEDQIDEGFKDALAKGVGGVAQGIGAVAGGAAGAWDRMKQGYAKGKAAVANPDAYFNQQAQEPASTTTAAAPATSTQTAPAPQATPDELQDIKQLIQKLNPEQKQDIAAQLTKPEIQQPSTQQPAPAAPTGTSVDIGQVKQQTAQQAQAAQADKQTAQQQIAATQATNAAKAKQDAAIKAAKDAAMAKPAFQQTASDKLAIQKAQQMGIREAVKESKQPKKPAPKQPAKKPSPGKKKKVMVEFDSKFLGQRI